MVSGYFGGWLDQIVSRLTEAFLAMPFLILAIAFAAFLGPSLTNAMIAIGLSAMPVFIRLTRGQVLSVKTEDYVEGARAIGLSHIRIMGNYILPNVLAPIVIQATLTIASAITAEASLSFLGLGQQPPAPSWGSALNVAKNFLTQAPWMALWPGAAIFLVVMGFNLMGDGLARRTRPPRNLIGEQYDVRLHHPPRTSGHVRRGHLNPLDRHGRGHEHAGKGRQCL